MASLTYAVLLIGALAVGTLVFMLISSSSLTVQSVSMAATLLGSLLYLAIKSELSRRQIRDLARLRDAYDQLDQQAKLIIRTDLELHRTQEELDHRLASLMSLHQLGQQLEVSLRPEEVFSKLDPTVVTNFGFAKGLLGLCKSFTEVEWRSRIGVTESVARQLQTHVVESGLLKHALTNPAPRTVVGSAGVAESKLLEALGVPSGVVAGVLPHAGPAGVLILGHSGSAVVNVKADEELVAILANQLATAVENSALYEKSWSAQRELELKVQERTRELAEANAGLVRLNKAKSDFVSAVSHELRTPLAAIKGYAALLNSGQFGELSKPQSERLMKVEKHSDLLTQFITNLLDIARIESGRITMERNVIQLKEFFGAIHDVVFPQMEAKRIRYTLDQDGIKELVGDSPHLQRVFVNLLSNAIKYTPEGGDIRVRLAREGDQVLATVTDTGCGIGADDLKNLFQEFYRAHDPINQQVRGTGLGLVLVKRIVEAHQGKIWVTSEKGKGSTFSVSLPST
jgi:signal transduction histidine kinase